MYIQSEISVSRLCVGKEQKGCIHPSSRKVEKESQRKAPKTNFPKPRQEFGLCIPKVKGIYARVAWILRNSGNENTDDQMERMVKAKDTNVYLETMEIIKNKDKEPDETWYA